MHSIFQRLNAVSALATTVMMFLLAALAATTFIIPAPLQPASLKVTSLDVVLGRSPYERPSRERPFVFTRFDLQADLRPLFNWNTKQLFVYFLAEYSTGSYPANQVVIWDRIVRKERDARINISDAKNKYQFKEKTDSFSNVTATFSLQYNVMPWVGILTYGEAGRTEPMQFPEARRR